MFDSILINSLFTYLIRYILPNENMKNFIKLSWKLCSENLHCRVQNHFSRVPEIAYQQGTVRGRC